jgi:hypothetical protein
VSVDGGNTYLNANRRSKAPTVGEQEVKYKIIVRNCGDFNLERVVVRDKCLDFREIIWWLKPGEKRVFSVEGPEDPCDHFQNDNLDANGNDLAEFAVKNVARVRARAWINCKKVIVRDRDCAWVKCEPPGANSPPVADAGPDQTALVGDTVTLVGSGSSDVDGDPITFSWSLLSIPEGSAATLSDPTVVNPTFVVDIFGTYVAQLVVNDGLADSAPDTVAISTANPPSAADTGND